MDALVLLLLVLGCASLSLGVGRSGEYCNTETFRAECSEGNVILMMEALYGRMQLGRCVRKTHGSLGCNTDVTQLADRKCSGRRVCEIRVPDAEFESTKPCDAELKLYLEISYTCLQVATTSRDHCENFDHMNLTSSTGYISSTVTSDIHECNGANHPWIIYAEPWQKINLTLWDFSVEDRISGTYNIPEEETEVDQCFHYGIIQDSETDEERAICGGRKRISHIYLSQSHIVKVFVTNDARGKLYKRFLIQYEVIGCPEPPLPARSVFERTDDGGRISCLYDEGSWRLRCQGSRWIGSYGNCSVRQIVEEPRAEERDETSAENTENEEEEELSMSIGITIAIVVGAVFGLILVLVIFCFVRYRRHQHRDSILMRQKAAAAAVPNDYQKNSPVHQLQPAQPGPETARLTEEVPLQTKLDLGNGDYITNGGAGKGSGNVNQSLCHHHHAVKVDGNDYEHIWEAPTFTIPHGTTIKADIKCSVHAKHLREPSYTTFKMENQFNEAKATQNSKHVNGLDLFPARAKIIDASAEKCRYSTLPNKKTRTNGRTNQQDLLL